MKKLVFILMIGLFVPPLGTLVFALTAGATMYIPLALPELTEDIRTWTGGSNYNSLFSGLDSTTQWIWNGVPFDLAEDSSGNTIYYTTTETSLTIPANVYGVTHAYTLINSAWGTAGVTVGKVEFYGSAGGYYEANLVEGTNVRDHYNGSFENSIDGVTALNAFTSKDGMDRLDMQIYNLPSSFATQTLTDIVFTTFAGNGGQPFIAAATVEETAGAITEFPTPTEGSGPFDITWGPDGNLWFTESDANNIGRITPTGVITEFPIGTTGAGITSGLDGNLWFADWANDKIGRITPTGVITEFPTPTKGSGPLNITWGPDGNLWFTEIDGNKIGRITTAGAINEFSVPTEDSGLQYIKVGSDGNLWFTEYFGNKIGQITTAGTITEFTIPTAGSAPRGITSGLDGNLWFTEFIGNKIGQITTAGVVTEFPIPTEGSGPLGITWGPDNNLWFTEVYPNNIGRITTAGAINEFSVSLPWDITWGPDGNLWFTEWDGNKIGQLTPPAVNISVTPMSNDYGDVKVKRSETASFVVGNKGTSNLTITSISIEGTDASMFKVSGGGSKTIKPGKSLTIRVAFKPTSTGSQSAILEITSNDPGTPTVDIPLLGTGQ